MLAGQAITNTGTPTVISGNLGLSPNGPSSVTGFPPGSIINGTEHAGDAAALQAQNDLTTAYNDAAGRIPPVAVTADLAGQILTPGVYKSASSMGLSGTVTLDGQNDPNSVFVFQAGSTLITGSSSTVNIINQANACNVFWQVGSSATLGTTTTFVGSILALTSATLDNGTNVTGRVLARNGSVTLDNNNVTVPAGCSTPSTPPVTPPVTPPGTVPQVPITTVPGGNVCLSVLPSKIKTNGVTVLLPNRCLTNANQVIKVSVTCTRIVLAETRATKRYCQKITRSNGRVVIKTYGYHHLIVKVVYHAPAKGIYAAYKKTKTYQIR